MAYMANSTKQLKIQVTYMDNSYTNKLMAYVANSTKTLKIAVAKGANSYTNQLSLPMWIIAFRSENKQTG